MNPTWHYWLTCSTVGQNLQGSHHPLISTQELHLTILQSQTKEQYLSRAVEVQPVFNRDVISELSDQAATSLLDCAAWAEGDATRYGSESSNGQGQVTPRLEQTEAESDLLDSVYRGDLQSIQDLLSHLDTSSTSAERITKTFVTAVSQAPDAGLDMLLATGLVDLRYQDEINDRNCLHKAAMSGRRKYLRIALRFGVDVMQVDAYGRIPLHYASMNGHVEAVQDLVQADPAAVDVQDLDNFTALIHAIVHSRLSSVQTLLEFHAQVDRLTEAGHVPLNLACQHGSLNITEILLSRNPAILPDAEGLFPQHLVARFGNDSRLLYLLQDHGADLDQPDKLYGWTPLFYAASEGRVECLQALLDCHVHVSTKDEKQQPALYYATWEGHLDCMRLLSTATVHDKDLLSTSNLTSQASKQSLVPSASADQIPDLSLPPPIIPTRRYGHNFLDNRSIVFITFGDAHTSAVTFYDESKYPAARLTITPRSQELLPRNILLPFQDENRVISFEVDSPDDFALEFDVFPTFGKKVIARGSVPSNAFQSSNASSGHHHLSLFDPRLRTVGQMSFSFQMVRPFQSLPRELMHFATYWKATSQLEDRPSAFITGSSLSGDYVRIVVQPSQDNVPIAWPSWTFHFAGLEVPVSSLTASALQSLQRSIPMPSITSIEPRTLADLQKALSTSTLKLETILESLPTEVNLDIHVRYPTRQDEVVWRFGSLPSINDFADSLLNIVFRHTEELRTAPSLGNRSIVFSSSNADLCTALNWKQPNCKPGQSIPSYLRGGFTDVISIRSHPTLQPSEHEHDAQIDCESRPGKC